MNRREHSSSSISSQPARAATPGEIVGGNVSARSATARTSTRRSGSRRGARGRGRSIAGWAVLLVIAASILTPAILGAVARAASPAPSGSGQSTGNDVAAGAALFQQSCASCHGAQAQGGYNPDGSARGPALNGVGAAAADFVLSTGRMPLTDPTQPMIRSKPAFNAQQIAQLVAFVASLGNGPAIPKVDTNGADLSHGRALFNANCASCHAPTGAGNAVGGGFDAPSLSQATAVQVAEAMRIGPPPMPVFGTSQLSQQDVNDIAAYVEYLQSAPSPGGLGIGEIGPVPEGFVAFVGGLTAVLLITRFVGRRGSTHQQTALHPTADAPASDTANASAGPTEGGAEV